ncbi:TPA: hypothetical protein ACYZ9R_005061 [Escherichia coli]
MRHNYLIMTAMLLPDPDVVRRFVPRTVVHWLRLLMILFNAAFRQGRHR